MGIDAPTPETPQVSWRPYVWLMVLVVGAIVMLQVSGMRAKSPERGTAAVNPSESLLTGDWYVKISFVSSGANRKQYARLAIEACKRALPAPAAYRRVGVAKEGLLEESGAAELELVDSRAATKGLSAAQIRKLRREAAMWRDVYGDGVIDARQVKPYLALIRSLNLGPLKQFAVGHVYCAAGEDRTCKAALSRAVDDALRSMTRAGMLLAIMAAAAALGVVLLVLFFGNNKNLFSRSPAARIQPSILLMSFLAYLLSYILLQFGVELATGSDDSSNGLIDLGMQAMMMAIAFAIGLTTLSRLAAITGESVREMGLRLGRLKEMLKWGVGGYCTALPAMGLALVISLILMKTVFRGIETPEHPLVPALMQGGAVFVAAFVVAVVFAPIVEETFFRGALYGALRGSMRVWPAALISGAIFAVIHPTLPGQFLPIMALGVILALIREKTSSLVPGMICHALNNAAALVLVRLFY